MLSDAWIRDLGSWGLLDSILVRNYVFLKNYVTLEGAVSHNVFFFFFFWFQQLSIARYQPIVDADNFFY